VIWGSLKYNVDLLEIYSKEEIVDALKKVEIFDTLRFPPKSNSQAKNKQ